MCDRRDQIQISPPETSSKTHQIWHTVQQWWNLGIKWKEFTNLLSQPQHQKHKKCFCGHYEGLRDNSYTVTPYLKYTGSAQFAYIKTRNKSLSSISKPSIWQTRHWITNCVNFHFKIFAILIWLLLKDLKLSSSNGGTAEALLLYENPSPTPCICVTQDFITD